MWCEWLSFIAWSAPYGSRQLFASGQSAGGEAWLPWRLRRTSTDEHPTAFHLDPALIYRGRPQQTIRDCTGGYLASDTTRSND